MMSFNAVINDTELTLSREWGDVNMNEDYMVVQDEELSATSNEEANKVFAEWKADDDLEGLMEIDEQIGSNLLDGALFDHEPCLSPTGPMEEMQFMNIEMIMDSDEKFLLPDLENTAPTSLEPKPAFHNKGLEAEYQASLQKLAESMRRSQETRRSLTLKTPKTKKYARSKDVSGVLNSVEQSSRQLQQLYLERNQRIM